MPRILLETRFDAPRQRVFDAARSVEYHTETMGRGERAVAGTTSGLLDEGDTVTWRARHFGLPMQLTVEIAEMDAPSYFQDQQIRGPFATLVHDHRFERENGQTVMEDVFEFTSPAGPLGTAVDQLVLKRYLRKLIASRNRELREIVEEEEEVAEEAEEKVEEE